MLKYKIYVLLLLLIGIVGFNYVGAKANDLVLLGKVIYLDPGHGALLKPNPLFTRACVRG